VAGLLTHPNRPRRPAELGIETTEPQRRMVLLLVLLVEDDC